MKPNRILSKDYLILRDDFYREVSKKGLSENWFIKIIICYSKIKWNGRRFAYLQEKQRKKSSLAVLNKN
jgi:hypothetical protein